MVFPCLIFYNYVHAMMNKTLPYRFFNARIISNHVALLFTILTLVGYKSYYMVDIVIPYCVNLALNPWFIGLLFRFASCCGCICIRNKCKLGTMLQWSCSSWCWYTILITYVHSFRHSSCISTFVTNGIACSTSSLFRSSSHFSNDQ